MMTILLKRIEALEERVKALETKRSPSTKFTPIQIISETTDNFLHGMATQAGLKTIEAYKQERKNK